MNDYEKELNKLMKEFEKKEKELSLVPEDTFSNNSQHNQLYRWLTEEKLKLMQRYNISTK